MTEHRIGQTWKDKRRNPTSTFTVLRISERKYSDGNTATRVKGLLVTDEGDCVLRVLDSRSAFTMYPYLLFDPPRKEEEIPQ